MDSLKAKEVAALKAKAETVVEPRYEWQPSVADQMSIFETFRRAREDAANDAEISRQLALAIGHLEQDISESYESSFWHDDGDRPTSYVVRWNGQWRDFSLRDPEVIYAIAEHYDCFPRKASDQTWTATRFHAGVPSGGVLRDLYFGSTPQEAVANAVIGVKIYGRVWSL